MYSISSYGRMIRDKERMAAYSDALRRSVAPESVVLDLGAGTGIFAILACSFGARRVFAIEPSDAINVARETAAANGFSHRIEFIQDFSSRVELPEKATVLVSDLRGVLPLLQHHIPTIVDARRRLIRSDAVMIPQQDTLWAAIVESPDLYRRYEEPWERNEFGLDLRAGKKPVIHSWRKARVSPEQMLTGPQCWATLDYPSIESPDIHGEIRYTVSQPGVGHGLIMWFDAELFEGVGFSNAPAASELIYGSAFFPWLSPVQLEVADEVIVRVGADLVGDDYVWRWDTRIMNGKQSQGIKADFKQSTFFGSHFNVEQLHKRSAAYVPRLSDDGKAINLILSMMDGKASTGEITHELKVRFPDRFRKWEDALTLVGEISQKYSV